MAFPAGLITQETVDIYKAALGQRDQQADALRKAGIDTGLNLVGVSLEAPAKSLVSVITPLVKIIGRKLNKSGGKTVDWRAVTGINTANVRPGVPSEGTRNTALTTTTEDKSATFVEFEMEGFTTMRAQALSKGFEDVRSRDVLNTLFASLIAQERVILGGQATNIGPVAGLAGTPVAGAGALDPAKTYKVSVSALTNYGRLAAQKAAAAPGVNEADGESVVTGAATITVAMGGGANDTITLTWTALRGAVAYNVFVVDNAGGVPAKFLATVSTNAYTVLAEGAGANPNLTNLTGSAREYTGILGSIEANANGAQFTSLNDGTLTSDGATGITQIDDLLQRMWDTYRLGPTRALMHAEQFGDISRKVSGSTPLAMRINITDGQKDLTGAVAVTSYLNKFASSFAEGIPNSFPLQVHPDMPPGTILFVVERVPYPIPGLTTTWEMEVAQEYLQMDFPRTQLKWEYGIYWIETLKSYFPVAQGALVGIKKG